MIPALLDLVPLRLSWRGLVLLRIVGGQEEQQDQGPNGEQDASGKPQEIFKHGA